MKSLNLHKSGLTKSERDRIIFEIWSGLGKPTYNEVIANLPKFGYEPISDHSIGLAITAHAKTIGWGQVKNK